MSWKQRAFAFASGSGLWVAIAGLMSGLAMLAPHRIKEWADAMQVNPSVVVLGLMVWLLAWRGQGQLLHAIRDNSDAIRALTHAVLADDDPPSQQRPRIIRP